MNNRTARECQEELNTISATLQQVDQRLTQVIKEMTSLQKDGIFDQIPKEIWEPRNGSEAKYLRLVFPTRNNKRIKTYIGCDPNKIADAQAKIERTKQHKALVHQKSSIERRLQNTNHNLSAASRHLATGNDW